MTERSADCRLYHGLCVHDLLVSVIREIPPVIRRWLRFPQSVVDPFPVCETPVTYDAVRMLFPRKCPRRQHRSQSPIQFHLHCMGFGTHHCYRRFKEQFPNALARQAPPRVQYSPWFVLSFFADAWAVLLAPWSHPDLVIGFDVTAGRLRASGRCQIRPPAFPIRIQ